MVGLFVVFVWKVVPLNVVWLLFTALEPHIVRDSNLNCLLIVWLRLEPLVMLITYTLVWLLLTRVGINCELRH